MIEENWYLYNGIYPVDYTHVHTDGIRKSIIDHVMVSTCVRDSGGVTHSINHVSNYSVINMVLKWIFT